MKWNFWRLFSVKVGSNCVFVCDVNAWKADDAAGHMRLGMSNQQSATGLSVPTLEAPTITGAGPWFATAACLADRPLLPHDWMMSHALFQLVTSRLLLVSTPL